MYTHIYTWYDNDRFVFKEKQTTIIIKYQYLRITIEDGK